MYIQYNKTTVQPQSRFQEPLDQTQHRSRSTCFALTMQNTIDPKNLCTKEDVLILGANGQWNCIKGFEKREDKNRRVETQYARNKTIHINHAYAIRRADIYSDLRETQKGKHVNGITKYRSQKLQHENGNANSTMHNKCVNSPQSLFVARKFSSHTGEVH